MATATPREVIAGLYAGTFKRSPDKGGLDFWESQANVAINAGLPIKTVYQEIMDGFVTNSVFINDVYLNISQFSLQK